MNVARVGLIVIVASLALLIFKSFGQAPPSTTKYEYLTIRWAGKENTHIVRPGGKVEFIGFELRKLPRPERADERSFFMNAAMNGLASEGYELAGMTPDDIVMRRPTGR